MSFFSPLFHHGVFLFFLFFTPSVFSMILSANREFGFLSPKMGVFCWVVY